MDAVELGSRVRAHRKRLHLSQSQLAARVGLSAPMISKIETGELADQVKYSLLKKFATVFQITPEELVRDAAEAARLQALEDTADRYHEAMLAIAVICAQIPGSPAATLVLHE